MRRACCFSILAALLFLPAMPARADGPFAVKMTIRDHKFEPSELHVPANMRVTIEITNEDPLAEEFDSPDLQIEKVVAGRSSGMVHLHMLDPGTYKFTGEYHADTAHGVVIAK